MTSDRSDFDSFLAARWPDLVRTLVFLGHPQAEAEVIALAALSRVLPGWRRMRREDDVDVRLYEELVEARERHLPAADGAVAGDRPAAPVSEVPPGLAEQSERRREVEAALAILAPEEREALVLRLVGGLSEGQLADVLGEPPLLPRTPAADDVRLAAEAVVVEPVGVDEVAGLVRARRRRLGLRTVAVAAVLVLLAGGGWWLTGAGGPHRPAPKVTQQTNPLPVPWYFDGVLHLADVAVEVEPVRELVQVPYGAVLSDDQGAVVTVAPDGRQTHVGDTVVGSPLVAEPDTGWVAWADPGQGDPLLIVFDTRLGEEVGRRSLASPGHGGGQPVGTSGPVAIDADLVYYSVDDATYAWDPVEGVAFSLAGQVTDVAAGARVTRLPDGSQLARPGSLDRGHAVRGHHLRLTPDGRYLFAVVRDETVVYDVASGHRLPRMYSPSDRALTWSYADGTFFFTVQHKLLDKHYQEILQMPSKGNYRIYQCRPHRADTCVEVTEVSEDVPDAPVLAQ